MAGRFAGRFVPSATGIESHFSQAIAISSLNVSYTDLANHLESLDTVVLITTGRTGSDFLQGLLDSHPEVVVFNGSLFFYTDFLLRSKCLKLDDYDVEDVVEEFIGLNIERFKSRYDLTEGKDRLGITGSEAISIDLNEFRRIAIGLANEMDRRPSSILISLYGAYHVCSGMDILNAKVLMHHAHHASESKIFLQDFPESLVLITTRDPRATLVSGIENWRNYSRRHDTGRHLYIYVKRIIEDTAPFAGWGRSCRAMRLEDLPREESLKLLCSWLGIRFEESVLQSTWQGLLWYGDRVSGRKIPAAKWTPNRTYNGWKERLTTKDQVMLNFLMYERLLNYGYKAIPRNFWQWILMPFIIPLPLRYEARFLSWSYIKNVEGKNLSRKAVTCAFNAFYYLKRVLLCYQYYLRSYTKAAHKGRWIGDSKHEPGVL